MQCEKVTVLAYVQGAYIMQRYTAARTGHPFLQYHVCCYRGDIVTVASSLTGEDKEDELARRNGYRVEVYCFSYLFGKHKWAETL